MESPNQTIKKRIWSFISMISVPIFDAKHDEKKKKKKNCD